MKLAIQVILTCLMLGSLYTLVALGLGLVFSIMRIVNFAHAQMYMLGAFGVFLLYGEAGMNYVVALVLTALAVALLGVIAELLVIRPVGGDQSRAMVSTLGLLLLLEGLAAVVFSQNNNYVAEPVNGSIHIEGAVVDVNKLAIAGVALVLTGLLFLLLKQTKLGQALRALAGNETAARLQGIHVGRMRSTGFAIGAGLAAVAGGLIAPLTVVNPYIGEPMILRMFIILILGGLGTLWGAVAGAFTLAAFETAGVTYFGQFAILGVYLLVIAVLLIRPTGILGHK